MLTVLTPRQTLTSGWAAEPKWDGNLALVSVAEGQVELRSRRGADMRTAFPEILTAAAQLRDGTALDRELVVWENRPAGRRAPPVPPATTRRRSRMGRRRAVRALRLNGTTSPPGPTSAAALSSRPSSPPASSPRPGRCAPRQPNRTSSTRGSPGDPIRHGASSTKDSTSPTDSAPADSRSTNHERQPRRSWARSPAP
ncbi:hypothetical protein [Streptomyces sp. NPDC048508]|uniref:ATP-dependent DNA ligase n=1 Tax=Streptomyces sp. NPDC048508 TaxID=3365561 RepID=UPI0037153574